LALLSDEEMWQINVEQLDISNCFRCVLGQLIGNYLSFPKREKWLRSKGLFGSDLIGICVAHGFTFRGCPTTETITALTAEWRRQIWARREPPEVPIRALPVKRREYETV
jgi:hypothetical protein